VGHDIRRLMRGENAKKRVFEFWNRLPCGTDFPGNEKFERYSRAYFDALEASRYAREPGVFSFAQFTRYHGCKVLEVGVGTGTDFLQWVRAGADAHGIDLTPEAIEIAQRRLAIYGLHAADLRTGDCEALPYADDTFDLVYSWGVIHHTPNTERALVEIVRVCRPGGTCKLMLYHRHSLVAFFLWARRALLTGRPWRSVAWCISHFMESAGTKAFTRAEVRRMLRKLPVEGVRIHTMLTVYDLLYDRPWPLRTAAKTLAGALGGDRLGWFMIVEFMKLPEQFAKGA